MIYTANTPKTIISLLFTLVFLALSNNVSSQQEDSLILLLDQSDANSIERAELLSELSQLYTKTSPEQAIYYAEQLLSLSKVLNIPKYQFRAHMNIGVGHAVGGNAVDKALQQFIQALDIAKQYDDEEWELRQVRATMNIVGVHFMNENNQQALKYSYTYVDQLEKLQDTSTLAASYEILALLHQTTETWDSVYHYLEKAKSLYAQVNDRKGLAQVRIIEGEVYSSIEDYPRALEIFNQVLLEAVQHQDTALLTNLCPELSDVYLKLGEVDNAMLYAHKGLKLVQDRSLYQQESKYYKVLHDIFTYTTQYDSALYYYRAYAEARETVLNEEKSRAVQEMEARFQVKQNIQENQRLKETVRVQTTQNTLLLISVILFLILLITSFIYYTRVKKQKTALEELNLEVFHANSQLLSLMNEKKHMVNLIAHDIRNPLSLIQLNTHALTQKDQFSALEQQQILKEIEQATNDIDQASLKIMEIENKSAGGITIQKDTFDISRPLNDAKQEFHSYASSKEIQLRFQIPQNGDYYIVGDPFLFRHIMANFISNALKYSPYGTEVDVQVHDHNQQVAISVIDQGPGLKLEDQQRIFQQGTTTELQPTAGERSLGEGLYLTKRYVEAMNGKIVVDSEPGKGSRFTVLFPKVA
jgi:signal transduction histidine kinase